MKNMFLEQVPNQMEEFDFKSNLWWGDNWPARKQNLNRSGGAPAPNIYVYVYRYKT